MTAGIPVTWCDRALPSPLFSPCLGWAYQPFWQQNSLPCRSLRLWSLQGKLSFYRTLCIRGRFGASALASISATTTSMLHSVLLMPAAIAGLKRSVLFWRMKL